MSFNSLKKPVKSIPFHWYFSSSIYQKEISNIFLKEWLYVCHLDSIKPNHYRTLQIDQKNIILIKNKNNQLSVYFNSCIHRGSQIFDSSEGKLKTPTIICPYHQWSYNITDGSLLNTTSINIQSFKKQKYSLKKVNHFIWKGLVFINFDSRAKFKLNNVFQYTDPTIEKLNLEKFVIGHVWKKVVNCNWKIYWENYSECLHCPNIHPELSDLVPLYQRRLVDIKDHPQWQILKDQNFNEKYQGGLKKGSETWSYDGSAQGRPIKEIKNDLLSRGQIYISTWPTMFLGIYGDHIRVVRLIPLGEEQVELTAEWLFEPSTLQDKKYNTKNVIDFAILVMNQDASISELNQKGVKNFNEKEEGVLMPEEYLIKDFHKYIRNKIQKRK